jgi:hypothetical protein
MKQKKLGGFIIVVITIIAGLNVSQNIQNKDFSNISIANMEALADPEYEGEASHCQRGDGICPIYDNNGHMTSIYYGFIPRPYN